MAQTQMHPYFARVSEPPSGEPPQHMSETAKQSCEQWLDQLRTKIAERPGLSVAIGLSLGVCLGWLVKRR